MALYHGDRKPRRGELLRLSCVLERSCEQFEAMVGLRDDVERRVARLTERTEVMLAAEPGRLERLETYRERLERAIERQTGQLRG